MLNKIGAQLIKNIICQCLNMKESNELSTAAFCGKKEEFGKLRKI